MTWVPGVASQYQTHWRQVSMPGTMARVAWCHAPWSTRTSTASMPVCCAQATPATAVRPRLMVDPPAGTSIRDSVLIAACADQPRWAQYAVSASYVVTLMSVTHLVADTYP